MRRIIFTLFVATMLVGSLAFQSIRRYADILSELHMKPDDARESIFINFQEGALDFPYSTIVIRYALGKRQAAVTALGDYIKAYVSTPEFAAKYKAAREETRPSGPRNADERIAERLAQIQHDIETNEAALPDARGEKKKLHELTLEQLRREQRALADPADPQHDHYVARRTKAGPGEANAAAAELKEWQERYPPTVKELVRKRLTEFLDLTKDINFNARLVARDGKMYFADPALEEKDGNWKKCFRCGKETITAARSYAQQWLASLK